MGFIAGHLGGQDAPQLLRSAAVQARRLLAHRAPAADAVTVQADWGHRQAVLVGDVRQAAHHLLAFEGRLTNRATLLAALHAVRHAPGGRDDADLVLAAWQAWGAAMLPRLEGAFALAVLDTEAATALLARDRFGERPLLFSRTSMGAIAFASEMGGLLAWPGLSRVPDADVIAHILAFGHAPVGGTPMAGVHRLRPGHAITLGADGAFSEICWWAPPAPTPAEDAGAAEPPAALIEAVLAGVRGASETATGTLLGSGDGGAVLAACLKRLDIPSGPDPALPPPDPALVQRMVMRQGEPIQPEALLPALAAGARGGRHVAPAGAAELALAHRRYRAFARNLERFDNPARPRVDDQAAAFHEGPLTARDLWHAASGAPSEAERLQASGSALIHTLVFAAPDTYGLSLEDMPAGTVMGRAAHLDLTQRLPARDLPALDAAAGMTGATFLCPMLDGSLVTRIAALPDAVRRRLLSPASVPPVDLGPWHPMGPALRAFTQEMLLGQTCRERDLFSHGYADALLRRHEAAPGADTTLLWAMLGIEVWCRIFLDQEQHAGEPSFAPAQEVPA